MPHTQERRQKNFEELQTSVIDPSSRNGSGEMYGHTDGRICREK